MRLGETWPEEARRSLRMLRSVKRLPPERRLLLLYWSPVRSDGPRLPRAAPAGAAVPARTQPRDSLQRHARRAELAALVPAGRDHPAHDVPRAALDRTGSSARRARSAWIGEARCAKLALPQDDYDHAETLDGWLEEARRRCRPHRIGGAVHRPSIREPRAGRRSSRCSPAMSTTRRCAAGRGLVRSPSATGTSSTGRRSCRTGSGVTAS